MESVCSGCGDTAEECAEYRTELAFNLGWCCTVCRHTDGASHG